MTVDASQLLVFLNAREDELHAVGREHAADQQSLFAALRTFLDDQIADDRAVDVVCNILLGVASERPLENDRHIYSDIYRAAKQPTTIRASAIRVLALVLAMPSCEYYVRVHGRPLLRAVYELRDELALSPEVLDALHALGIDWELGEIQTMNDAWAILTAMCTTDHDQVVPAAGCVNVWEHLAAGTVIAGDAAIAGFLRTHPRAFETEVLLRASELAITKGTKQSKNALAQFLDSGFDKPATWGMTHACFDAELGLRLFSLAHSRNLLDGATAHNSFHVARAWLAREPAGYDALAREMVDVFRGLTDGSPLPDILPPELDQQSPDQIEAALASYAGITLEQLYARLLPGGVSSSGFIQPGERLGQLIATDAETLRCLGFSRHELADRLEALIARGGFDDEWNDHPPWRVKAVAFMGHQQDPFHIYDVYDFNGHLGSKDFSIQCDELQVSGGDLQLSLIRRACFFGGLGCYRIDPAEAVALVQRGDI